MKHTIDATNQSLGRIASKVAILLRGKDKPTFEAYHIASDQVVITNVKKIKFTGKKFQDKTYFHYSGYPGGMKSRTLENAWVKSPAEVVRKAVYGMLPNNRQRSRIIKNLIIE